jgi:hypothetical protein
MGELRIPMFSTVTGDKVLHSRDLNSYPLPSFRFSFCFFYLSLLFLIRITAHWAKNMLRSVHFQKAIQNVLLSIPEWTEKEDPAKKEANSGIFSQFSFF